MRIGVDANEANVTNRVGSNVYAYKILWQLYRQGKTDNWVIYLSSQPAADLPKPRANWQYRVIKPGFFWTQWRLPLELFWRRPRPDRFLTLGHYAPRFSPVPTLICVMDLAFLKFPETFRARDLWQLTCWTRYSIKKATHVFAISRATKKDIINRYNVSSEKISVAYPGVEKLPVTGKSPVKGKYLLYVGTLQPRKNIAALIDAFSAFTSEVGDFSPRRCELVIAGKVGWKYKIKKVPRVKYLGYVPSGELGPLIKNAVGLVLPSLYEGFGIPVVQAMSLGVPVLVSRNSSLVEIVGDSGLYIEPPFDAAAIRFGLEKLINLIPAEKQKLIAVARARAAQFAWPKTGKIILNKVVK